MQHKPDPEPELKPDPVEPESNLSDEEYQEAEAELDDLDDEDQPLDEDDLENEFDEEDIIVPVIKKKKLNKTSIKTEEINQKEEELDDTVFIDNLPKDERSIRIMLKDVNRHIRDLEKKFFEEEDSEDQEDHI